SAFRGKAESWSSAPLRSRSSSPGSKCLFRKPLSPCTQGERGWDEGENGLHCARHTHSPPAPLPLSTGERGERNRLSEQPLPRSPAGILGLPFSWRLS